MVHPKNQVLLEMLKWNLISLKVRDCKKVKTFKTTKNFGAIILKQKKKKNLPWFAKRNTPGRVGGTTVVEL